ncbi:MAG: N5-glutamine methyltransferase family protein [Candidatus Saccharimonadales bacterium]
MMSTKIISWLNTATATLSSADILTARLDSLVLLEDTTGKDRGWLLAHPEYELSQTQVKKLDGFIERRTTHEPLAYIRHKTEFYGREFYVDRRVLEPRPDSETMIDLLKSLKLLSKSIIIDIGTGSGALAITAKLELPQNQVLASDNDPNCLTIARGNASRLAAEINFYQGDLLNGVPSNMLRLPATIIMNLPYVPDDFPINKAAESEPKTAILGGSDGLDLYRQIFRQITKLELKPDYILTEAMPPQHERLAEIAGAAGFRLTKTDDFIQLFEQF